MVRPQMANANLEAERLRIMDERQPAVAQVKAWEQKIKDNDGTELLQEATQQRNADPEYQKLKTEKNAVTAAIRDDKKMADKEKAKDKVEGKDVEKGRGKHR